MSDKFKFFSNIEQSIDITKNVFEECSDANKFFSIKTIQVYDEEKLVCECDITIFNFSIDSLGEFLEDFTDDCSKERLQIIDENYTQIENCDLDFQELAVIKTTNSNDGVSENLKKYLLNNILNLISVYFCIEIKVALSSSSDKIFGTNTGKDRVRISKIVK